ncbi:putative metal-binding motif-containing protein [Pyxidicoccus sp. 3LFB2]
MRHVAISALCVLFLACSKEEQAGVRVEVDYTASFKTGCFVVRSLDAAGVELAKEPITDLSKGPPLRVAVLRKEGWPEKVQFLVTAHEQTCEGPQVDDAAAELDLSGAGFQEGKTAKLELATPDVDGDGYVPTVNGGTDCNDASGNARPNGPVETCDGLDNDCKDGIDTGLPRTEYFADADGDGVGAGAPVPACVAPPNHVALSGDCDDTNAARTPNKQEQCNNFDDDCDGDTDEGFEKEWYGDGDGDSYGAQSKRTLSCEPQVAGHVRVTGNNFDCDDDKADVNPGAAEKCNDRDDNCANGADETFLTGAQPKNGNCANDVCGGVYICDPANDTRTACNALPPTLYYADVDVDSQGAEGSTAQKVCAGDPIPMGKVLNATDCDDVDPGTKQGVTEICDGLDNNCNGQTDEGLNCGGVFLQVFDSRLGNDGHDWRTVAVDPNDGYPVWIAGLAGKLVVRNAPNAAFVSHSYGDSPANTTNCGEHDWYAAWVRPSDGHVFLAGEGGRVSEHTGSACTNQDDIPGSDDATGMVGFESGGVTTLYIVKAGGRLVTWVPGSAPVERHNANPLIFNDIHALDANRLLVAVRTSGTPGSQFVTSYLNGNLGTPTPHTLSSSVNGGMNAVWMGGASLACAVGDGGAAWRWNGGTGWSLAEALPGGATPSFSSVVMPPGLNVAYIVDKGSPGKLRRLTQYGWARAPRLLQAGSPPPPTDPDVPLYDIAMTSVGDFWVVGDNGRVYHYPQP